MRQWLRRLSSFSPRLLSGIACTLFRAWELPLFRASRGFGPWDALLSRWHRGPSSGLWSDHATGLNHPEDLDTDTAQAGQAEKTAAKLVQVNLALVFSIASDDWVG